MIRILLIEDDRPLRMQIRFALEGDYNIYEAGNFSEAAESLRTNEIEIIILDMGLPPSEGTPKEGLRTIEHVLERYECKIIVLTGQQSEAVALESIKRGVFDYLLKPIDMERLFFSLERAVKYIEAEKRLAQEEGLTQVSLNVRVGEGLQSLREEAEKKLIKKVLNETGFNVYKTAKILGLKRESIYYFIKKFGWKRESNDTL